MDEENKILKEIESVGRYFLIYGITLVYLELLLRSNITGGITGSFLFFLCFIPAEALFFTLLSGLFKDRKNIIVSSLVLLFITIYYIAQLIYYKNFGSLFSASMIGMGMEAVSNFGWAVLDVIKNNLLEIILMFLPILLTIGLSAFSIIEQQQIGIFSRLSVLVLIVPLWLLGVLATRIDGMDRQSAYSVYHNSLSDTDNTSSHLGAMTTAILECGSAYFGLFSSDNIGLTQVDVGVLTNLENTIEANQPSSPTESADVEQEVKKAPAVPQIFEELDFEKLAENAESDELKELTEYLGSRSVSYTNDYTGMFEGYNLIYICAEAFWSYALDEQVTPTLCNMANQGIVLNNYYNSFKNTTTNGEFAFATSLWPDLSRKADAGTDVGSFYQSATCYMPLGLGDFFNNINVPSYGYHNYYGEYYRRILSWPNLGYTCKFYKRGMEFTSSWPASDLELMEQSVDDYINNKRFHAYYMTFSGHGPYSNANQIYNKNIKTVKALMKEGYNEDVYGYLAGNYELDKAMEYLLKRLEEAGCLDNTVIVIAGDHYPYNLSDKGRNQLAGYEMNPDFDIYKSTCIIYNAGMKEPVISDTYCSNVDIVPTILNLFGIRYDSRLFMGRDIFAEGVHKAVTYNMSFITDLVRYNSRTGETIWFGNAANYSDSVKETYLNTMIELLKSEYYASLKILNLNFYQYAWYNSGLMTDEELAEEQIRVEQVKAKDAQYNIRDAQANEQQNEKTDITEPQTTEPLIEQPAEGPPVMESPDESVAEGELMEPPTDDDAAEDTLTEPQADETAITDT